jgi:hypothetical protein
MRWALLRALRFTALPLREGFRPNDANTEMRAQPVASERPFRFVADWAVCERLLHRPRRIRRRSFVATSPPMTTQAW